MGSAVARAWACVEVLDLIFGELDRPALRAALLVCRAWASSAIAILWRRADARQLRHVAGAWTRRALYASAVRELDLGASARAVHAAQSWAFGRLLKLRLHPAAIEAPDVLGVLLAGCSGGGGVAEVVVGEPPRVSFLSGSTALSDSGSEDGDATEGPDDDDDDVGLALLGHEDSMSAVLRASTLVLLAFQPGLRRVALGSAWIIPLIAINAVFRAAGAVSGQGPRGPPFASLRCFAGKTAVNDAPELIGLLARCNTLVELSLDLHVQAAATVHQSPYTAGVVDTLVELLPRLRQLLLRAGLTYGDDLVMEHALNHVAFDAASIFGPYYHLDPVAAAAAAAADAAAAAAAATAAIDFKNANTYNNNNNHILQLHADSINFPGEFGAARTPLHRDVFVPLHHLRALTSLSLFGTHAVYMPDARPPSPAQQRELAEYYADLRYRFLPGHEHYFSQQQQRHHRLSRFASSASAATESDGAAAWRALLTGLPLLERLAVGRPCTLPFAALDIAAECCRGLREVELLAPVPGAKALCDALDRGWSPNLRRVAFPELRRLYLWSPVISMEQSWTATEEMRRRYMERLARHAPQLEHLLFWP